MIETDHSVHPQSGLPIYSLYSETRQPTAKMLDGIDTILIDLQIVGCRVYTFKYTIAACLRAAAERNLQVVLFDRPNPMGGKWVEGRILEKDATSFVGEFPIPMRHGLSSGEAALFFNKEIGAQLQVFKMENWDPERTWHENGLHWVITSPNLPTADSVYVYPGTVIFEGTNVSEGRGTALPFQFIGAPFFNSRRITDRVRELYGNDDSVFLRETEFQPTYQKWAGKVCQGFQIHVLNSMNIRAFDLGLAALKACMEEGGEQFQWKQPPYEYDHVTLPIKLILGTQEAVKFLEDSRFKIHESPWQDGLKVYIEKASQVLLYPRKLSCFR